MATCEFCHKGFEDKDVVEYGGVPEYGLGGGRYCQRCCDLVRNDFDTQVKAMEELAKVLERDKKEKIEEGT